VVDQSAGPVPDADPGLARDRLIGLFGARGDYRVGLVVAPAGSGKSTLIAQVARRHPGPVAWLDITDPTPRTTAALVGALRRAVGPHVRGLEGPASIDELLGALAAAGESILVVVDDAHLLDGVEAEEALAALVHRLPPPARLLMGSRVYLDLDLSRARVSGRLVEVGLDDLRFRTWEVEQLFEGVYGDRLGPEDAAVLTRRTAGWAAYLQLFHLAIARRTPVQRRQVLRSLGNPSRTVRDYLSRQVLADLSDELRDFLIRTSVLRRPTPELCDQLLGRTGSAEVLAELERRQVFTERVDFDDSYRYHAVLLSYLDSRLVETVGVPAARDAHGRAAALLEASGYVEEAVTAYAKAEDWPGVHRLLEQLGVSGGPTVGDSLLDLLPPSTFDSDPWLLMVKARRALGRGSLRAAVAALTAAEAAASGPLADRCREQRTRVTAWLFSDPVGGTGWSTLLRAATQRAPTEAARRAVHLREATGRFVEAAAALMVGDVRSASRVAGMVTGHEDADALLAAGAQIIAAVADFVGCENEPASSQQLQEAIEAAEMPWLDRLARAVMAVRAGGREQELDLVRRACQADGDRWGEVLVTALEAAAGMVAGIDPGDRIRAVGAATGFERAAAAFGELGAGVLETWSQAFSAICWWQSGDEARTVAAAQQTRTLAGLREVPGALAVAALVLGTVTKDERQLAWAAQALQPLGLWTGVRALLRPPLPPRDLAPDPPVGSRAAAGSVSPPAGAGGEAGPGGLVPVAAGPAPPVAPLAGSAVRCLGGFALWIDGVEVDETAAKPMERAALHVLAMRAGEEVHREELGEMLWPGAPPDAARHRLQVAVSALRRLLGGGDGPTRLVRRGDTYRLDLPGEADVDVWRLRDATRAATVARAAGDEAGEAAALESALDVYRGPLLPGDGPADWVVGPRAAAQASASDAALRLATLRRAAGALDAASRAARAGLGIDRYRDDLWRVAIGIAEDAGHHAEAAQLRQAYEAMLGEIGIIPCH
jgi:serine/threonine-protein kinase PknK